MRKPVKSKVKNLQKIAIIGLGGQARSELIPAILHLRNECEITAICDISPELIAETKKLIPNSENIHVYKDYKDLFRDAKEKDGFHLDGVVASVPHFLYTEIVEQALQNSIAVFKEKPFALNLEEAKKISALALKENTQVYTVTKRQFYPSYAMGLQLIHDGVLGTIYMYSARHFIPHGNLYEGWRSTIPAAGGGVLIDMGYHLLDVIMRYFGDVSHAELYWSNTGKPNYSYEVEDAASLLMWHPIGVHGVFQMAALSGPKEEMIEVRGTKGRMVVTKSDVKLYDLFGELVDTFAFATDSIDAATEAFHEFLSNNQSIWSQNISHNMKMMRVLEMAYKRRYK